MTSLNFEQMESIVGGNFLDGFCTTLAVFSAGAGLAVLTGVTVATGGFAAWLWGGAVTGCAIYGVVQLAS